MSGAGKVNRRWRREKKIKDKEGRRELIMKEDGIRKSNDGDV